MERIKKHIKRGLQWIIPQRYILWTPRTKGSVFVTFDDGPHPEFTPRVLDLLDAADVKATFFLVGEKAIKHRALTEEILARGHAIGNHTYSHVCLRDLAPSDYDQQVKRTAGVLSDIAGRNIGAFRPPWGLLNLRSLTYLLRNGFQTVLWTLDSLDYQRSSERLITERIHGSRIDIGDILLFHDDNEYTLGSLPDVLGDLSSRGFRAEALLDGSRQSR